MSSDHLDRQDHDVGDDRIRHFFYSFGLIVLTIFAIEAASTELIPIILAVLIWFLINGIAHALRTIPIIQYILPMWLATVLAAIVVGFAAFLAGRLVLSNVTDLSEGIGDFSDRMARVVEQLEAALGVNFGLDVRAALKDVKIENFLGDIASTVSSTANAIMLTLLYVLFLLLDQPFYDAKIRALFPDPQRQARARAVLARIGSSTRAYVWVMTIVSVGVGLLTYAISEYFGLRAAPFWGFLAFALNYIPTIGTFLGILAPAAYALLQFDNLQSVAAFAVALSVVQFIMGNILLPRITGNTLNLSQFVVILSLTVWGVLWGPAGLFLAVPIMMVLTIVLSQLDSTRPLAILLSQNGRVGRD